LGQHALFSASCSNPSFSRYNVLDMNSQEWYDLHFPLPDAPILPFTQPETLSTDFIPSTDLSSNPPSTFSAEVATFITERKSEV